MAETLKIRFPVPAISVETTFDKLFLFGGSHNDGYRLHAEDDTALP